MTSKPKKINLKKVSRNLLKSAKALTKYLTKKTKKQKEKDLRDFKSKKFTVWKVINSVMKTIELDMKNHQMLWLEPLNSWRRKRVRISSSNMSVTLKEPSEKV
jgi:hypothetical protein